jgi:hypothetical protein
MSRRRRHATPTNTPVATNTPMNTPTNTAVPTSTDTATSTPVGVPTNTPVPPTSTSTPAPGQCLTFGQRISLIVNIAIRLGANKSYDARFDVNHDGVINVRDLLQVIRTPVCGR